MNSKKVLINVCQKLTSACVVFVVLTMPTLNKTFLDKNVAYVIFYKAVHHKNIIACYIT